MATFREVALLQPLLWQHCNIVTSTFLFVNPYVSAVLYKGVCHDDSLCQVNQRLAIPYVAWYMYVLKMSEKKTGGIHRSK